VRSGGRACELMAAVAATPNPGTQGSHRPLLWWVNGLSGLARSGAERAHACRSLRFNPPWIGAMELRQDVPTAGLLSWRGAGRVCGRARNWADSCPPRVHT